MNADSAKIGLSEEEIRSIPSNHSKMTKFGSSESIGFQRVSSQIRRWVEKVSSNEGTLVKGLTSSDESGAIRSITDTTQTLPHQSLLI